ncbi:hypothetical protein ACR77V_13205, partial [Staphylococcus epidermidis]|uniref:hypothetical protein n=1 Tax=Staphylococcus epidermidis TaxID=1282 RepID=UPI003DA54BCB
KIMDAMKPVMDFFSGIIQQIVETLGDLIGRLAEFLGSSGIFQKIVHGVMGVGNAILNFVIAPFKGVIAAIKVFKEQGIKGIGDAARAFGAEMKQGVAFKQNFNAGQVAADTILDGMASRKPKAKETGKDLAKEVGKGLTEELDKILDKVNNAWDKKQQDRQKLHEQRQKEIADYNKQSMADFLAEQEEEADEAAELWLESYRKQTEAAKDAAKQKLDAIQTYASGASGLLNSVADMLEEEGQSAKNLRIAAATIDMIQGAVTAFSTAQQLGPIAGPIVGAINAAAVVASGLANIAKIKSTKVSKDSAPSQAAPQTPQATVNAPALASAVPTTTVVNGASTEAALNRAAQPQ